MSTQNQQFILIGISDAPNPVFTPKILGHINKGIVFAGGLRHYQLVQHWLPENHQWITIKGSMQSVFDKIERSTQPVVVFVSGDPFFYGMGTTLAKAFPSAKILNFPYFNSLQRLCQLTQTPYHALKTISVHGRSWEALDAAIVAGEKQIGILTDRHKNPEAIAARLEKYGFKNYAMLIGENLEGADQNIRKVELTEVKNASFAELNCVVLQKKDNKFPAKSAPDHWYKTLPGRPKMITKRALRSIDLQLLNLHNASVFWDIGACTGALAIEAKKQFPNLRVIAIEKRPECAAIIEENTILHQCPGVEMHIEDFFNLNLKALPKPDAIFIGGHGGALLEMISLLEQELSPGGMLVMNAVLESSVSSFRKGVSTAGWNSQHEQKIQLDSFNPIHLLEAKKTP